MFALVPGRNSAITSPSSDRGILIDVVLGNAGAVTLQKCGQISDMPPPTCVQLVLRRNLMSS